MEGTYSNRTFAVIFSVVFSFLLVVAAFAFGCTDKAAQPIDIPKQSAVEPLPDTRIRLEQLGAVKMKAPDPAPAAAPVVLPKDSPKHVIAKAKAPVKLSIVLPKVYNAAEAAAVAKAAKNAERVKCLNFVVDTKIASDIEVGEIRDFGSAILAKTCRQYMTQATPGTLVGIRAFGGPGVIGIQFRST